MACVSGDVHQADLFAGVDRRSAKLMAVLSQAKEKLGRGAIGLASSGWKRKAAWECDKKHVACLHQGIAESAGCLAEKRKQKSHPKVASRNRPIIKP